MSACTEEHTSSVTKTDHTRIVFDWNVVILARWDDWKLNLHRRLISTNFYRRPRYSIVVVERMIINNFNLELSAILATLSSLLSNHFI